MTDKLKQIEDRFNSLPLWVWKLTYNGRLMLMSEGEEIAWIRPHDSSAEAALYGYFMVHAPTDIKFLLNEVKRLRNKIDDGDDLDDE